MQICLLKLLFVQEFISHRNRLLTYPQLPGKQLSDAVQQGARGFLGREKDELNVPVSMQQ